MDAHGILLIILILVILIAIITIFNVITAIRTNYSISKLALFPPSQSLSSRCPLHEELRKLNQRQSLSSSNHNV